MLEFLKEDRLRMLIVVTLLLLAVMLTVIGMSASIRAAEQQMPAQGGCACGDLDLNKQDS